MIHPYLNKHLRLESTTTLEKANFILLGVPFDGTSTHYPGTRMAPLEIRKEFLELEKDQDYDFWNEIKLFDLGNIEVVHGDVNETIKRTTQVVKETIGKNPNATLITLGGEHLITLPIIQAMGEKIQNVISLDAHPDLKDDYMGVNLSHATVMKRIHELGKNISIYGARSMDEGEIDYAKKEGILIEGPDYEDKKIPRSDKIYLTIDMDVFDPKIMPGVGNPTPDGIKFSKLIRTINHLSENIIAIDFVETNPLLNQESSVVAADILLKTMKIIHGIKK